MEYKIEVIMTPHVHDSPVLPYFWCILSCAVMAPGVTAVMAGL